MKLICMFVLASVVATKQGTKPTCHDADETVLDQQYINSPITEEVTDIDSRWELTKCFIPAREALTMKSVDASNLAATIATFKDIIEKAKQDFSQKCTQELEKVNLHLEKQNIKLKEIDDLLKSLKNVKIMNTKESSVSVPQAGCKKSEITLTALNGHRYYFSHDYPMLSWTDASLFCKKHYMDLVSVESREEWETIKPEVHKLLIKFGWSPWSSATDSASEGQWKWTTGTNVIFYAQNKMKNLEDQDCMYLYPEHWADYPCSSKAPFICEVNAVC